MNINEMFNIYFYMQNRPLTRENVQFKITYTEHS